MPRTPFLRLQQQRNNANCSHRFWQSRRRVHRPRERFSYAFFVTLLLYLHFFLYSARRFLADRTNGRAYCTSVVCLSVTFCIVAERYVVGGRRWYRWIWRWEVPIGCH